ncbi:MAG: hypothetical protein ACREFX_10010 [Opitutaceae bacterium]
MDNCDSEGPIEDGWEERGDLAWNEFDWERYLRQQDDAIHRYLGFYESFRALPDRIDRVAQQMGWEPAVAQGTPEAGGGDESEDAESDYLGEDEVYTLHKNPVFVATKAIMLCIQRSWELLAVDPGKVPPGLAIPYLASLHRGEEQAVQALHALDFGDYALAVSLFKRALAALNRSLAVLGDETDRDSGALREYRVRTRRGLFDLREIWLRVISECREELDRPVEEED